MISSTLRSPKKSYAKITEVLEVPNLIQVQLNSFRWFQEQGLKQLFEEISPIQDFIGTRLELRFLDYYIYPLTEQREDLTEAEKQRYRPKYSEQECQQRDMTYSAPLYVRVQLLIKETGEVKEQDLFLGDFPLMTTKGTFIINGAERVVVSQLIRSPGVYFTLEQDIASGRSYALPSSSPIAGHG